MLGDGFGSKSKPAKKQKAKPKAKSAGFAENIFNRGFQYTGGVRPGEMSPVQAVPEVIGRPDYAKDGKPKAKGPLLPWQIEEKTPEQIAAMRVSGRIAREVLDAAGRAVKPGMTTNEIDVLVHQETLKRESYPSPLNYHGFPKSCCTSVNEIVCHGIPDSTVLQDGDIINVDVTIFHNGYHGDCSETFLVGDVDEAGRELVKVTWDCWQAAIAICEPGRPYKDIGDVIENYIRPYKYSTVRNFCGHGIGSVFHTNPTVLHFTNNDNNGVMQEGHVFTIEPMINEGTHRNVQWPDDWTAATADGKRSAQFEHTLLITSDGVEALTQKLPSSPKYFWEQ